MLRLRCEFEVLYPVVALVFVLVVDDFPAFEGTAQVLTHNETVGVYVSGAPGVWVVRAVYGRVTCTD
jgi:hypothetical protein